MQRTYQSILSPRGGWGEGERGQGVGVLLTCSGIMETGAVSKKADPKSIGLGKVLVVDRTTVFYKGLPCNVNEVGNYGVILGNYSNQFKER